MPKFQPPPAPPGTRQLVDHEARLTRLADVLDERALAMLADLAPIMASRGKELALAAIRARKVAAELATKRLEIDHLDWLLAENRKLQGNR